MARLCILDSRTNQCVNIIEIKNKKNWKDFGNFKKAPRHDGNIGQYLKEDGEWDNEEIPETYEEKCEKIRIRRNKFLVIHVDPINAVRWNSFTEEQKEKWSEYRQALLDIPEQEDFPENVVWPTIPDV
jgi:hypothetical protein